MVAKNSNRSFGYDVAVWYRCKHHCKKALVERIAIYHNKWMFEILNVPEDEYHINQSLKYSTLVLVENVSHNTHLPTNMAMSVFFL